MEFLLSHWHCILPAAAILVGVLLMGRSPRQKTNGPTNRPNDKENRNV